MAFTRHLLRAAAVSQLAGVVLAVSGTATVLEAQSTALVRTPGSYGSVALDARFDDVFTPAGWSAFTFGSTFAQITASNPSLIWLDGGNFSYSDLLGFVAGNSAALATYVQNGGRLVLNAAPFVDPNVQVLPVQLFGDVTLEGDEFASGSFDVNAVDPAHPIFAGLAQTSFTAVPGQYTQGWLTIANGSTASALLTDDQGRTVLAEQRVGEGCLMFGTLTDPHFHSLTPNNASDPTNRLIRNIIGRAASGNCDPITTPPPGSVVPEPSTYALLATGLAGLALAARRRRRIAA